MVFYALVISRFPQYAPKVSQCHVGYVYDGDTVELLCDGVSSTARLIGFDTPETRDASCDRERALGKKATIRLRKIITSGKVKIIRDGHDRYGRELAQIFVEGRNVGDILIEEKLARAYEGGSRVHWCDFL